MQHKTHTVYLLLVTMAAAVGGEAEPALSNAQVSSSDHVYSKYFIKYLGLEDHKQQQSTGSAHKSPFIYTAPQDQDDFAKYVTYTSDGANIYEVTIQMKPGSYPVIWSTPVQAKSSAAGVKDSGDTDSNAEQSNPVNNKNENIPEHAPPMPLPLGGQDLLEMTTIQSGNLDKESTEQPKPAESHEEHYHHEEHHHHKEYQHGGSRDKKEPSNNQVAEGSRKDVYRTSHPTRTPFYIPSHYGAISFYPVAYNPFTGQVKYVVRPVGAMTGSTMPSMAQQGDGASHPAMTTLKPFTTMRPSPIPVGITTSGTPLRVNPISYMYPFVSYQPKNSRVMVNTIHSPIVQWVQAMPAARYQATYSQGYMAYKPSVPNQYLSALQSPQPSGQVSAMKLSATPTINTSEMTGQQ